MENANPTTTTSLFTEIWNTSSTAIPPGGQEQPPISFEFHFFRLALTLQRICNPVILCLGTIGNVMTVVIMRRGLTSDDTTINIYFTAIAVVDLLYLWTIVLEQLIFYNLYIDIKTVHGVFCKIFTWLYTGGGTVSCWYLVCMTVHRAMSVVWPHRVNVLCTRRTVLLMLTAVTVIIALLYSHYLIGYDRVRLKNGSYRCMTSTQEHHYFHSNVFVYIELLVYSALPFLMIVLANSILTWKLVVSAKRAQQNLTAGSAQASNREKEATSVTLTVMAVSLTFLVLTLPSSVNYLFNHFALTGHGQISQSLWYGMLAVSYVCGLVGHANHAINFYLYCLTGRRFREEFFKLLCCGRGVRRPRMSSVKETGSG